MTRTSIVLAILVGVLSYGCGNTNHEAIAASTPPPAGGPSFSLRLAGVDAGDFVSARMRIESVQVSGGGAVLANAVLTPEVDLAQAGQAYLLTSFAVPAGLEDVEFAIAFSAGTVSTARSTLSVDTECHTLRLSGKVSRIAERKHAVIQLDVARSLIPFGSGLMLLPHFQLVY
jgi:hypothetical protein